VVLIVALGASIARGDVVTSVTGSKLVVTGDDDPDAVTIEPGDGGVAVIGLQGTLVDGSAAGVTVFGVTRVTLRLRGGADRLTLTDVSFPDGIGLRLGKGDDVVVLDRADGGATRVRTDNGYDAVYVDGPSRYRHLSILTSRGRDVVEVTNAWVRGDLYVDTGSEDDYVSIVATEVDDASVYLGSDDDVLVLGDVVVYDDTDLDGDDGDDWLALYGYVWFADDLDIDGFDGDWW
jgi:hypothetical protein